MSGLKDKLIHVPEFLSIPAVKPQQTRAADCNQCEHQNQCGWCESVCQNCMGTACLSVCQTVAEGGCTNNCDTSCQTCQRCEGATCQVCQNCEGASCQSCQCSTQNNQGSPPSSPGIISIGNVTDTSITVNLTAISGATSYNIVWHADGASAIYTKTSSLSYTFTGLIPETVYLFNYYGINSYGTGPYATTVTATTSKKKPLIEPWSWSASNGLASIAQTSKAYSAVSNYGKLSDFSYLVWNDMVNKANDVAVAAGDSWIVPSGYLSLSATLMSSYSKGLSAKRFNSLKVNIGSRISTGIQDVSQGDVVKGSYFITLMQKLNEWIATL